MVTAAHRSPDGFQLSLMVGLLPGVLLSLALFLVLPVLSAMELAEGESDLSAPVLVLSVLMGLAGLGYFGLISLTKAGKIEDRASFGPVALSCRSWYSFKPLSVRKRLGFSSPVLNCGGADCRSR